jgi:choline dehydrogenase-like flavoprotein
METTQQTTWFSVDAPPREHRPLRLGPPEIYDYLTADGVRLQLTRYKGGTKGPVLVAPGFGTSHVAFTIDTVDTTFPEYLYAHGYDVWLFDYRASPLLAASSTQFSVDDIATQDYPATVDKVLEVSGADSVQVMAHCVGSMAFMMGMLAGLQGVRSAVCSQLTTHPRPPAISHIKADMHLASFLPAMGLGTMTTNTDVEHEDWRERIFDRALKYYPSREQCDSPICHRILFMYGDVYKHAMLNDATHHAIWEMFGLANMRTFQHLATIVHHGHVVDVHGENVYLPNVERLNIPIAFIHGAENNLFRPEGSEITYNWLRENNGEELYTRHVIPNYAHMDCFIGKDASRDVYPVVLEELEKGNRSEATI